MLRLLLVPLIAFAVFSIACGEAKESRKATPTPQAAVAITPSPCPTQAPAPAGSNATFTVTPNTLKAGSSVTVAGSGFTPNSVITAIGIGPAGLCLPLGSGPADAQGRFTDTRTVQALAPPGNYQIRLTDATGRTATQSVTLQP